MPLSSRPTIKQRWLLTVQHESCWLPGAPRISSTGQIAFEIDAACVLTFHTWLMPAIAGKRVTLDGAVSAFDGDLDEQSRYEFKSATVTSIGFPTLDGALHTPGRLTLTLNARILTPTAGSGNRVSTVTDQPPWRCSDFRMLIDRINAARVSRIDAIHVTIPGPFPTLNVLVPAVDIKQFLDWQKSGATATSKIQFLAPDHSKSLFTLSFTSKVSSIAYTNGGSPQRRKQSIKVTNVPVALAVTGSLLVKG